MSRSAWHGVVVASPTLFHDDMSIDLDRFQDHVRLLAQNGCDGVTPAGSMGEYQVLTEPERRDLVRCAVQAAPEGFSVIPGVSAYGGDESYRWAVEAAKAGADAVLCQPPNSYRANTREVVAHFGRVAEAGLPIVAYNNPVDNRVDLTPELLAEVVAAVPSVVAVKDFSGDVARAYRIKELAPQVDILAGMDGVMLELVLAGAVGWIAGFPNSLPRLCTSIFRRAVSGDVSAAMELYRQAQPLLRWDAHRHFVQAVKVSMDAASLYGGPCRLPRLPLDREVEREIRAVTVALAGLE